MNTTAMNSTTAEALAKEIRFIPFSKTPDGQKRYSPLCSRGQATSQSLTA
jgi:hypothetical protein